MTPHRTEVPVPLRPITTLDEYRAAHARSLADPDGFWAEEAQVLEWFHPFAQVLDADLDEVDFSWFGHGRLNAAYNCVDRHARTTPDKVAIRWVGNEPGEGKDLTYRALKHQVARFANVLKEHGVRRGDRVCIYLPMIPEAAVAMLACARIGAIHSVVFGGFSADSLRDRILDAGCKVLITADEGPRGAKRVHLKQLADQAIGGLDQITSVLVARRTGAPVPMKAGRDHYLDVELARQRSTCPVEWMSAEDPLFVLYTSGSTGKPKGLLHTTGGYLVHAASSFQRIFAIQPDDVFFATADIGWITGHTYVVYGPLASGATIVMYEGVPNYPDPGRLWQIVDQTGATVLYTAPTALRALIQAGDDWVKRSSRQSLRLLGTVGEPINPEVWTWYHEVVGEGRCGIVDTWWQTETGGAMITPLAGITPTKPGSATLPYLGIEPLLVDDDGRRIDGNAVSGNLCVGKPWPGQARSIWGDHSRYRETYFARFPGLYFTGDGCTRDADGYYWITGRVDDVLNVSGHRLGTAEIESALVAHEAVAEAAVVGFPHDIKGTGICAYVAVRGGQRDDEAAELAGALKEQVRQAIGAIAAPDRIVVVTGLPKTRSGKIMRRILRKLAAGQTTDLGDLTTLAEPSVVDDIIATLAGGSR
ncbi:MAG: acetate--CoA ligase [Kofleriaceae bacterium]|nr:acetate--CoA ligase [Kofleriaceae bacterium]MBP9168458.1 acetate--CoA ligase [Kofleriaceae bacterium]MBP9858906.1 acetate--CoA ligase [Kofleriaceae bacterium]